MLTKQEAADKLGWTDQHYAYYKQDYDEYVEQHGDPIETPHLMDDAFLLLNPLWYDWIARYKHELGGMENYDLVGQYNFITDIYN